MLKKYPKSKLRQKCYPSTDPEQSEALSRDEVLLNFTLLREKKSEDPYRPTYHFVNPEHTMNDPNGLCFWRDRWHLFYQVRPIADQRLHWGHAYSDDLIHWNDLPNALFPGPENDCYSGTILVENNRAIAMYHGTGIGNMVATASDERLLNWSKVGNKAVIPFTPDQSEKPYGIFDPCIFSLNGFYYSVSAGLVEGSIEGKHRATNFLFRSTDLKAWEYVHEFMDEETFTIEGDDGACPYFLPLGDKYILIFFSHMTGAQYLLGDLDQDLMKFHPTAHGRFNYGATFPSGVHAPTAFPLPDGDIVIMFNMNTSLPRYSLDNFLTNYYGADRCARITREWAEGSEDLAWDQIMTLPRRLSLRSIDCVAQTPFEGIETCRGVEHRYENIVIAPNTFQEFEGVTGDVAEIFMSADLTKCQSFTVRVLATEDHREFTDINIYPKRGKIYRTPIDGDACAHRVMSTAMSKVVRRTGTFAVDVSNSSLDPDYVSRPPEVTEYDENHDGTTNIRIFLDRSVVEVFVNDQVAISVRAFPSLNAAKRIQFLSRGRETRVSKLSCWQMQSIYPEKSH